MQETDRKTLLERIIQRTKALGWEYNREGVLCQIQLGTDGPIFYFSQVSTSDIKKAERLLSGFESGIMNPPEGVHLGIEREVELDCDCKDGKRPELRRVGNLRPPVRTGKLLECYQCHGTGRIKRRLRGWVEAAVHWERRGQDAMGQCGIAVNKPGEYWTDWHSTPEPMFKSITEFIIATYLDGTLPDEIAKNLQVEDV